MTGTIRRGKALRADLALWDGRNTTASRIDATGGTITGVPIGDRVDVLQLFGGGTDRTHTSLQSALNFISTNRACLTLAPGTWTVGSNLTIPSNVSLHVPAGCTISIDNGVTLTVNGLTISDAPAFTTGSGTASFVGGVQGPYITAAETAASATPSDYSVPSHELSGVVFAARYSMRPSSSGATNRQALNAGLAVLDGTLNGGVVCVGSGRYSIDATVTLPQNSIIDGQGTSATQIQFDPASEDILFDLNVGGGVSIVRSGIRNLGFYSTNSITKTAISVTDGRQCKIENVAINQGNWPGNGSIGIRTYGRDFYRIQNCDIECARPLLISANPNFATIHFDVSEVSNTQFYTPLSTGSCVEVENGVEMSNMKFDTVDFAGGKYGFYWSDSATTLSSFGLSFINCRTEQMADATGFSFYLNATGSQRLQDLLLDSCHVSPDACGLFVRGGERITLRNTVFTGGSGITNLDITFGTTTVLVLENTHVQVGSTVTLTNAVLVWAAPWNPSETAMPKWAIYRYDEGYASNAANLVSQKPSFFGDMRFFPWTQTLTDDQQINLPVRAVDGMDSALVFVGAYGSTGPVKAAAMVHFTPGGSDIVSFNGSVVNTNTDGNLCILDGGAGALSVINRLGQSVKLSFFTFFAN